MAFFDGFFSSLGQLLPGYTEGRQEAIEDNWNDMNQFNQVLAGQTENAFNLETFDERARMMRDAAERSYYGALNDAMTLQLNQAYQPMRMTYATMASRYAPETAAFINDAQRNQADWISQYWGNPTGAMQAMDINSMMWPNFFGAVSGLGTSTNIPSIMQ